MVQQAETESLARPEKQEVSETQDRSETRERSVHLVIQADPEPQELLDLQDHPDLPEIHLELCHKSSGDTWTQMSHAELEGTIVHDDPWMISKRRKETMK